MAEPKMYITARLRKSPFFEETVKAGATTFSVYNKTYLPGGYDTMEAEFWGLVKGVGLWDVTCQRNVEISGPDGRAFMNYLTPRNLEKVRPGQCRYVLITNPEGGIMNDPVMLCLEENRFWLSRADSDIYMWARGLAVNVGFDVTVREPETATLQVQGPNALALLQRLSNEPIADIKYYHHRQAHVAGIPVIVARTGWSAERGYELYLQDLAAGPRLYQALMAEGQDLGIKPGSPSRIRRIEAGILDYSVDMDETTNPFELGLERLVDLSPEANYIGKAALEELAKQPPQRLITGLMIEGEEVTANDEAYPVIRDGEAVGRMTSWVYSPRLEANIGLAMIATGHREEGTDLTIEAPGGPRKARVVPQPFVDPNRTLARAE